MALQTLEPEKLEATRRLMAVAKKQLEQRPPEEIAAANEQWKLRNKIASYFPDEGPFRRELYHRHLEFFQAGKKHNVRAFVGGNRIGKNIAAAYEVTCHMTGIYPRWWKGYRFRKPTKWWICGRTWKEARDANQEQLLGQPDIDDALGTGMIPAHLIAKTALNPHIKFGFESFQVKHISGGVSNAQFKVYEQGWQAFEAIAVDGIWLDELCPLDVFSSCKTRTMNTEGGVNNGMIILTFTPLLGLTDLVKQLREQAVNSEDLPW
mgnify:FL=1